MATVYLFADEAGDFTFRRKQGASRFFIIGTVTMEDCSTGDRLVALRRELIWRGHILEVFHASADRQAVRDEVYDLIANSDVRIDATILEKAKAQPHLRQDHPRFYKQAMFMHLKYVLPQITQPRDRLVVVASSLQIKKKKGALADAVEDVVDQAARVSRYVTGFHAAATDPCLQIADYATWAIQRKWEQGDSRAFRQISHLVKSEFDAFAWGRTNYY